MPNSQGLRIVSAVVRIVAITLLLLLPAASADAAVECPKAPTPNEPPTANNDYYPYPYTNPLTVLANDYDPDGDPMVVDQVLSATPGATWAIVDGGRAIKFDLPNGVTSGTLRYTIRDGVHADRPAADVFIDTLGKPVDFAASCNGIKCSFSAIMPDPVGVRSITWKFGDEQRPEWNGPNVYIEFPYVAPGVTQSWPVTIMVSYFGGAEGRMTRSVSVTGLPHDITYKVRPRDYGQGGAESLYQVITILSTTLPETTTLRYLLTFSSTGPLLEPPPTLLNQAQTLNVIFTTPGTYDIEFKAQRQTRADFTAVWQNAGAPESIGRRVIVVEDGPPFPHFTVAQTTPQSFTFDPSGHTKDDRPLNGTDYLFEWDFGDGDFGVSACPGNAPQAVSHSYLRSGTYNVHFKVTDIRGGESRSLMKSVTVANLAPKAHFWFTCAGLTCDFDGIDSADQEGIDSYQWTFGDGETGAGVNTRKTFRLPGCYQVDLRTVDYAGAPGTTRRTVPVGNVQRALPGFATVDSHSFDWGTRSNLNGILEPGEIVAVEPSRKVSALDNTTMTGTMTGFSGPAGASYQLQDTSADYGVPGLNSTTNCWSTGNCYVVSVDAMTRPTDHWDANLTEANNILGNANFSIHIGDTFVDVPRSNPFYPYIEAFSHWGVTTGCAPRQFCPSTSARRDFVVFLMRARNVKLGLQLPTCTTAPFADIPCSDPAAPYLLQAKQLGVTSGCDGVNFCPNAPIDRAQVAVMVIKALGVTPPSCNAHFADVACSATSKHWAADFISEMYRRGLTAGCGGTPLNYCPDGVVTRDMMSAFVVRAFDLAIAHSDCAPGTPIYGFEAPPTP